MIEKLKLYFFRSILHSLFSSHQIHLVHKVMLDNGNHVLFFYHCVRHYQHLPNDFSFNWPMNPQSLNFVVVGATSSIFIISVHHPSKQYIDRFVLLNRMESLKINASTSSFWLSPHVALARMSVCYASNH